MKNLKYYKNTLLVVMLLFGFTGCKKDIATQQENSNPIYPRIFDVNRVFSSASIINAGDTAKFNGVLYTPANKVKISWQVNNVQMGTDTSFNFKPTTGGEFTIKL